MNAKMRIRLAAAFFALACGLATAGQSDPGRPGDDERFTALTAPVERLGEPGFDHTQVFVERFRELWTDEDFGAGLETASDEALRMRLRAVSTASFYRPDDWILARYRAALDEAHARGIATREDFRDLFDAYLAASRYAQAERLVRSHPEMDLPEVPEIVPPDSAPSDHHRVLWRVADDPLRLEGFQVDPESPRLLVVSSPGCGFCRMAARALAADEVLGPLMREHTLWLAAKSGNNTYSRMLRFNREYPDAPHYYVDDPADWPVSRFDFTPRFHFTDDGEVRETLAGWGGGSEALWAIARGFATIGLLDVDALPDDAFAYADERTPARRCPTRQKAKERIVERTPIRTREDLDAHLGQLQNADDSPFEGLSAEARQRFVDSLRFHDNGYVSFRIDDLEAQLDDRGIYRVTSLFGEQFFFAGKLFPEELLSGEERELKAMLECTGEFAIETAADSRSGLRSAPDSPSTGDQEQ
jgi:hypothetical protein